MCPADMRPGAWVGVGFDGLLGVLIPFLGHGPSTTRGRELIRTNFANSSYVDHNRYEAVSRPKPAHWQAVLKFA
jgi:hypothetical protein